MIGKRGEVVQALEVRGRLLRGRDIDRVSDVIREVVLEGIHDGRHLGSVLIRLPACRVPGVELRLDGGDLSNANVRRKNAIQRRVQRFQVVEAYRRRREVRDLARRMDTRCHHLALLAWQSRECRQGVLHLLLDGHQIRLHLPS